MTNQEDRSLSSLAQIAAEPGYHENKIKDLIKWLEAQEESSEKHAQAAFDADDTKEQIKQLNLGNMAFRTRMWIRNHVLLSPDEE